MMDRKKKILYGEIAAGAVLVLVVVAIVMINQPSRVPNMCVPLTNRPDLETAEVKTVAYFNEDDGPVLANLAGYLELFSSSGASTYLPLNIDCIRTTRQEADSARIIILGGQCVKFEITYTSLGHGNDENYYTFTNLEMFVENDAEQSNKTRDKICTFDDKFFFTMQTNLRYSCKQDLFHQCSTDAEPVASLVLKSFELELDGNPVDVGRREFSKTPWAESCDYWSS